MFFLEHTKKNPSYKVRGLKGTLLFISRNTLEIVSHYETW